MGRFTLVDGNTGKEVWKFSAGAADLRVARNGRRPDRYQCAGRADLLPGQLDECATPFSC